MLERIFTLRCIEKEFITQVQSAYNSHISFWGNLTVWPFLTEVAWSQSRFMLMNSHTYSNGLEEMIRILEWVANFLLQGTFPTQGSNLGLLHGKQFFTNWASRETIPMRSLGSCQSSIQSSLLGAWLWDIETTNDWKWCISQQMQWLSLRMVRPTLCLWVVFIMDPQQLLDTWGNY